MRAAARQQRGVLGVYRSLGLLLCLNVVCTSLASVVVVVVVVVATAAAVVVVVVVVVV